MDEQAAGAQEQAKPTRGSSPCPDWALIGLLLLLAVGLRVWMISQTTVAARDSIGFIRYVWQLENQPWKQVFRNNPHPPIYPLTVLAVSIPLRQLLPGPLSVQMQFCAQLASALAGILLVLPMYFLGQELFSRKVGFWGTCLFMFLPVVARVTSDALSEGVFLLFAVSALALAVRAVRTRWVWGMAWCGLFSSLAYLTRPEGMLVAVSAGLVLLGVQWVPNWRWPWRRWCLASGALTLSILLIACPYVLVMGRVTNKPTAMDILSGACSDPAHRPAVPGEDSCRVERIVPGQSALEQRGPFFRQGPLLASTLAVTWHGKWEQENSPSWWACRAICNEIIKDFHYFAAFPALLGFWWHRKRLWDAPWFWIPVLLCVLQVLVVWRVVLLRGYVSQRHLLILVLCGTYPAVAAVPQLIRRLPALADRRSRLLEGLAFLALVGFGLPEGLKPIHASRAGHRAAGLWLEKNSQPYDVIIDPFCWAYFYSGRMFLEGAKPLPPPGSEPRVFVVMETPREEDLQTPDIVEAAALASKGAIVFRCPAYLKKNPWEEIRVFEVLPGAH